MTEFAKLTHPDYKLMIKDWKKFRLTFAGGDDFLEEYLEKFSIRESDTDFRNRKKISYIPTHAKAAVIDIKNAIYQRMVDIKREGGSETYRNAIKGIGRGVDLEGNSMNSFIGRLILPELLTVAKVGVYIDKTSINTSPYIYMYTAENIRSWAFNKQRILTTLLLRDHIDITDSETHLVIGEDVRFRLIQKQDEGVLVKMFNSDGNQIDEILLDISTIPFVIFMVNQSLLTDVSSYQISLLNLASSDMNYSVKSNFPFYTEQYNPTAELAFNRLNTPDSNATDAENKIVKDNEIKVGATSGRRYTKDLERPAFINPSPDPLRVSMEKQEMLKQEIRQLVNLSLTNIAPQRASAESKQEDKQGLEAGLSYIGFELEFGEREIAKIWEEYEQTGEKVTVIYPKKYSIKTDKDRREEGNELKLLLPVIPSLTYQKAIAKEIANITMGHKLTNEDLNKIHIEIDESAIVVIDPDVIAKDLENGLVTRSTASIARGYDKNEAENAKEEHAQRAADIIKAQSSAQARGVKELDPNPKARLRQQIK